MTTTTLDENSTLTMNEKELIPFDGNILVNNFDLLLSGIRENYYKQEYKNILSIPYIVRHIPIDTLHINYEIEHLNPFLNDIDGLIDYLKEIWPKIKEEKIFDTIFVTHKEINILNKE